MPATADAPQLWWHFYGASIPDKYDVTLLIAGTDLPPAEAEHRKPSSEIDGVELTYLTSWDHRPTIAELNLPRIFAGMSPETQADNCDEYGDVLPDDDDGW